MIINTAKPFVFIHVPKTGGSSIARNLSELPGNATHLCHQRTKHETLSQLTMRTPEQTADLSDFFKFGFVRNPWDKIASLYRYLKEHRPRPEIDSVKSFADFISQMDDRVEWIMSLHSLRPQRDFFVNLAGQLEVDFIGHYEFLANDFRRISVHLGLSAPLSHENKSTHFGRDYRPAFSDQQVDVVKRHFETDIETFGYEFECPDPTSPIIFDRNQAQ